MRNAPVLPLPEKKVAEWYADMKRKGQGSRDEGRYIRIEVPKDLDDVELKFLDEYWELVRQTIGRFSRRRMFRKAVSGDFGLPGEQE